MSETINLSIVILSYNTKEILKNCLQSLYSKLGGISYEIIVVDNDSKDGSREYLYGLMETRRDTRCFFMDENLGFGRANNFGVKKCRGKYILLLNSDTVIKNDVINKVIGWMKKNPSYAVASSNLYNVDGTVQGTGGYFPTLLRVFSWMTIQDLPFIDLLIKPFHPMRSNSFFKGLSFYQRERDLDWVTGAFLMTTRSVFEDVGGFDEEFFMYMEEVELCYRIKRKGWKVKYLPYDGVIHLGGASGTVGLSVLREFEGVKLFYRKHCPKWQYPVLRMFFKIGCFWRIPVMGLLKGRGAAKIYAKALIEA